MTRPLLALTLGDPNGIGPEVVLKAARDDRVREAARVVAVGSATVLADQAERLGLGPVHAVQDPAVAAPPGALAVLDTGGPGAGGAAYAWGETTAAGGAQAMAAVARACDLCLGGLGAGGPEAGGAVDGMVTAPLSKEAIHLAGYDFPGHTEFLQAWTGAETVVMVLASETERGPLRVALVTIHVPISAVPRLVTRGRIADVCRTLAAALRRDLGVETPRLAVLGLNPHAGDGGVIGGEEAATIRPALGALRADGLDVAGPFPADAFFGRAAWSRFDAVVAMYHDQGLAPFKAIAQGAGVNVTLGLPIVRTSPDHGTAFDLAGRGGPQGGGADPGSMVEAVLLAAQMARRRMGG
ncbi:4-hydroxythreonine-4-phosphate dehydrogenase PdxA [Rubrivirga litoralis]|uniref:4-hydroxythreonine-4-phosphate dehydrogenase n=1 Tax=Rubrivirga litoralis TaxID=3075598 RepID=A0ABU3BVD8_9BACT|nr:4-hydroxythreonine-4-phosphate dehydrogenase PdxA [Rubrivirga sp. F394]MDT0633250.1 4-hydroxythreonine-4-phosphate dehydrogenase PdxA [Rubrivirga sp. F394]